MSVKPIIECSYISHNNGEFSITNIVTLRQMDESMALQHSASAGQVAGWLAFHRFTNYLHLFQQYTGTAR